MQRKRKSGKRIEAKTEGGETVSIRDPKTGERIKFKLIDEEQKKKSRQHYPWWGYVKSIVRDYATQCMEDLTGVAVVNYEAVLEAVNATERMADGRNRLKVIRMVHWDRTHTLEGAAITIPCSRRTAAYWQREFFETVARNRGLLD